MIVLEQEAEDFCKLLEALGSDKVWIVRSLLNRLKQTEDALEKALQPTKFVLSPNDREPRENWKDYVGE